MNTNPENAYRNGTMYSSYTAASFAREYLLADSFKANLSGAVSWAFEFENQPWFAGFRDLATNGVDKPVLNVFRMLGMMKGKRVAVNCNRMYDLGTFIDSSVRGLPDIGAMAAKDTRSATILAWNYHDEDLQEPTEDIRVNVSGLPSARVTLTEYRIDREHSNSYESWKKMGSPQNPTPEQVALLERSGQLQMMNRPIELDSGGKLVIGISLPRQGVSLIRLDW
jgi:xylan 1,4-beta-xylosidase